MNHQLIRILTALPRLGKRDANVTHIAALLGLSKSTVSRYLQELAEQGLVLQSGRTFRLSVTGGRQAQTYTERFDRLCGLLRRQGVPPEQAVRDSYTMLATLSAETLSALSRGGAAGDLPPEQYLESRPDGIYDLAFAIYNTRVKGVRSLSMANSAFRHPAQLTLREGRGVIRLESLPVQHPSAFHDQLMSGMLRQMSYLKGERYRDCLIEGDTVCLPADALHMTAVPEHGLLIGEVMLNIVPNIDERHMPVRTALFTAYL